MPADRQLLLFTDFGPYGPYMGQMESVLRRLAPKIPVIHLLCDAPSGNPRLSAYLLSALRYSFPPDSVFLAIVDPGVGGERKPVVLYADGQYFVGPGNGLLNTIAVQARQTAWYEISFQPEVCSVSFHGRDIFAPVAAKLAKGKADTMLKVMQPPDLDAWSADLGEVIYVDYYGNVVTGLRYHENYADRTLYVKQHALRQAKTFCYVPPGTAFWYKNSNGLVEIAVNQGRAVERLNLVLGEYVGFESN